MAEPVSTAPVNSPDVTALSNPGSVLVPRNSKPLERVQQQLMTAGERCSVAISRLRRQISYLANERPLELIAAVAAISLLTGVALRIWRSNSYE
jgi:hypothetical protein